MATNVITPDNSRTAQLVDLDANPFLLVTEDAYIISDVLGRPAYFASGGGGSITVKGSVIATPTSGYSGVHVGATESPTSGGGNQVHIASSGLAEGKSGVSMFGGGNTLTNDGEIRGTGTDGATNSNVSSGVYMLGANNHVANNGTIRGYFGIYCKGNNTTISNIGTIAYTGTSVLEAIRVIGTATIDNSGTIKGDVATSNGAATLTNTGLIDGAVRVTGSLHINNYGTITGQCSTGTGDDVILNYGSINSISSAAGQDFIRNEAGAFIGDVTFTPPLTSDTAFDRLENAGSLGSVAFSSQGGYLLNSGHIFRDVNMAGGFSTIDNYGIIDGGVVGGSQSEFVTNNGTMNSIFTGAGSDTVQNDSDGSIRRVTLGAGDADGDTLLNSGTIGTYNSFTVAVFFADGGDRLINRGTIYGGASLGGGDDSVDTSDGVMYRLVDLGAGNDTYAGSDSADRVLGGANADVIDLAGGKDVYLAAASDGKDDVDGGDGIDTYNASDVALACTIDLGAGTTAGTIGFDTISNFENIIGGSKGDTLTGSDGANRIDGGAGADSIDGGAGNDRLIGGASSDAITGGAGRDVMTGGAAAGSTEGDTFVFAGGDSGITAATRDAITDFTDHGSATAPFAAGADTLDLRLIDANAGAAGNQAFSFNATEGAAFSGAAGSLVWEQFGAFALVSGDTNGDSKADFTIQLNGTHTLFASDFML